jgi:UDP-glucose-4-epimerase GalE
VSAVIHFAASAYVGESMRDPSGYFNNNVANTIRLLDAMRAVGVGKLVFSSSCATYGIPERMPIGEDTPQQPINPYGESKLMCEKLARWYGEAYGLKWAALRYFNAAGADPDAEIGEDHNPETHLIPIVLDIGSSAGGGGSDTVKVFGTDYPTPDGTCVRDYVHVSDLADAHVRALDYLEEGTSGAFNLGTGKGHSVLEIIQASSEVVGHAIPWEAHASRPGDPPELVAAPGRAGTVLEWVPRRSELQMIIGDAWRWRGEHVSRCSDTHMGGQDYPGRPS